MNTTKHISKVLLASMLMLLFFGLIAYLIKIEQLVRFDLAIIHFVQGLETPFLTSLASIFTFIGDTLRVIMITLLSMLFLYKVLHHRRELYLMLGVMVGSTVFNQVLKHIFQRERPDLHRLAEATGYSFPSGHSMAAFALYGVLTYLLWKHIPTGIGRSLLLLASTLLILLIGFSRIYLGVHYPSDIIGGYLASGFCLSIAIWTYERYTQGQYVHDH